MAKMKVKDLTVWVKPSFLSRQAFLMGAILSLALILRLFRLDEKDIWWDEGWSVWLARQDLISIAVRTASDEHPPLHYWLLHFWRITAGEGEFSLRFLSVVFSVLTVALVYQMGREISGKAVGLLAALLLALSRFHIWWSQEIKMYALGIFLALLSLYLFMKVLRKGRWPQWLAYIAVTVSALYTLYLAILVVIVENIFFFFTLINRLPIFSKSRSQGEGGIALYDMPRQPKTSLSQAQGRLLWLLSQGAILFFYIPWVYIYFTHSFPYQRQATFDLGLALRLYATVLPLGISTHLEEYAPQTVFFLVLAALGLAFALRSSRPCQEGALLSHLALAIVPVALLTFSLPEQSIYQPKVSERYTILFLPMYMLMIALGLRWFWTRDHITGWKAWALGLPPLALTLGILATTLADYYPSRQRTYHLPALARFLSTFALPEDAILLYPDADWPVYRYHVKEDLHWFRIPYGAKMSPQEADHWLDPIPKAHSTLWLITTPESARTDPAGEVRRWLDGRFKKVDTITFGRVRLTLYSQEEGRDTYVLPPQKAPLVKDQGAFSGPYKFLGFDPIPRRVKAGNTIYIASYLEVPLDAHGEHYTRAVFRASDGAEVISRRPKPLPMPRERRPDTPTEVIQVRDRIAVNPKVPPGSYNIGLEVTGPSPGELWEFPIGTVQVEGSPKGQSLLPATPIDFNLGGRAFLRGFTLDATQARPGGKLSLTLFWEAAAEMDISYTAFVHLKDDEDVVWAVGDSIPQGGTNPTTAWSEGDLVEDEHSVPIAEVVPPGSYVVTVGMYDITTGERLEAVEACSECSIKTEGQKMRQDKIYLGEVEIVKGP